MTMTMFTSKHTLCYVSNVNMESQLIPFFSENIFSHAIQNMTLSSFQENVN